MWFNRILFKNVITKTFFLSHSSQLRLSSELEGATIEPFLGKSPSDAYNTFTSNYLISVDDETVISYQGFMDVLDLDYLIKTKFSRLRHLF